MSATSHPSAADVATGHPAASYSQRPQRPAARAFCLTWLLGALLLMLAAAPTRAHQASDAYLRVAPAPDGTVALQVDVALRDLDELLALDADGDGRLRWGEVRGREAEIVRQVAGQLRINAGQCALGATAPLALDRKADGTYAVLKLAAPCPLSGATLDYALLQGIDPTHRGLLLQVDAAGQPVGAVRSVAPGAQGLRLIEAPTAPDSAAAALAKPDAARASFFGDGLHHILIGADHVLFLVCLLLPVALGAAAGKGDWKAGRKADGYGGGGFANSSPAPWRQRMWTLLGLVTAFTVAHSITLALAAWRVLAVPPSVIEPLIAATIVLTALDNLRPFLGRRRAWAAFGFGLIHGFGFAGPLLELALPAVPMAWALLQFNLGVEVGQLIVVGAALAVLALLRSRLPELAPPLLRAGSVAVGLLALVWLGERIGDFKVLPI